MNANSNPYHDLTHPLDVDAIIVGAGPVGIISALLLSQQGLKCLLLEKNSIQQKSTHKNNSFDGRTLALNIESVKLLESLNCLPNEENTQAIENIRVSQQGHFGSCLLESARENLSYFGLTVNSIDLGQKMHESLVAECTANNNLQFFEGIRIDDITQSTDADNNTVVTLSVCDNDYAQFQITSKILIAADGSESHVREHFNFPTERKDYHQVATLTKVTHQNKHLNMAHERFLKNGILALLPTPLQTDKPLHIEQSNQGKPIGFISSVVWLQDKANAIDAKALLQEELLEALEQRFGQQYGKFLNASPCMTYNMQEIVATTTHKNNVILIGNAAHSLHPVAGQGLNLGLQDAHNLAYQISLTGCHSRSLRNFATIQQTMIANVQRFVNDLLNRFASPHRLSALSRAILMIGFEKCTPIRRPFLHHLSGVQKNPPWFWHGREIIQTCLNDDVCKKAKKSYLSR